MYTSTKTRSGFIAERNFLYALQDLSIPLAPLWRTTELIALMKSTPEGRSRHRKAVTPLLREFSSLEDVPPRIYMDYAMGVDYCIAYRGWVIAIDITLDERQVDHKVETHQSLEHQFSALQIDRTAVIHIRDTFTSADLRKALSRVIQGEKSISI